MWYRFSIFHFLQGIPKGTLWVALCWIGRTPYLFDIALFNDENDEGKIQSNPLKGLFECPVERVSSKRTPDTFNTRKHGPKSDNDKQSKSPVGRCERDKVESVGSEHQPSLTIQNQWPGLQPQHPEARFHDPSLYHVRTPGSPSRFDLPFIGRQSEKSPSPESKIARIDVSHPDVDRGPF